MRVNRYREELALLELEPLKNESEILELKTQILKALYEFKDDTERHEYLRFTDLEFFNELPADLKKSNIHDEITSYLEMRNKKNLFEIDSEEFSFNSDDDGEEDQGCGESGSGESEENSEQSSDSYQSNSGNTYESYDSEEDDMVPNYYGGKDKDEGKKFNPHFLRGRVLLEQFSLKNLSQVFKNLPFTIKVFMVSLYDQCFGLYHPKIELFDIKEFRFSN